MAFSDLLSLLLNNKLTSPLKKSRHQRARRPVVRLVSAAESLERRQLLSSTTASTVWNDANGDGIFDVGVESVATGITVSLVSAGGDAQIGGGDDTLVGTRPTNAFGFAFFTNLNAGSYYYQYNLPNGKVATVRDQGTNDSRDSDVGIDNRSHVFTLGDNDTEYLVDLGITDASKTATTLFNDTNTNGTFDLGETTQNGVTVQLFFAGSDGQIGGNDDLLIDTKITSGSGLAFFGGLSSGSYYYNYERPADKAFTLRGVGPSEALDSDAGNDGISDLFTLAPGGSEYLVDAGLTAAGIAGTTSWFDTNKDGIFDSGSEPTFSQGQVMVTLHSAGADGQVGGGDDQIIKTIPSIGTAVFDNLNFGAYYYSYVIPTSSFFTFRNQGSSEGLDSDVGTDGISEVFILSPTKPTEFLIDLGVIELPPGSAATTVWDDANSDGIFDAGETTIDGITVRLFDVGLDGQIGGGDDTLTQTLLTTNGFAHFRDVRANTSYYYEYDNLPTGKGFTLRDQGANETKDSDVGADNRSEVFQIQTGGGQFHVDAGLADAAKTATTIWNDSNGDGRFDPPGELIVPGVTTQLFWAGQDGQVGGGDDVLIDSKQTNASGFAIYNNLSAGDYYYHYVAPAGTGLTIPGQGPDPARDSNADINTGNSNVFTLTPGGAEYLVDAGIVTNTGTIETTVWNDLDSNGIRNVGTENGVPGVTVRLIHLGFDGQYGVDDVVIGTTITDSQGIARFNNVGVGTFGLVYTRPNGTAFTLVDQGVDDTLDSDAENTIPTSLVGRSRVFTMAAGAFESSMDAGLITTATESLTVSINPGTINENGGGATGTVTRSGSTVGNLTVTLLSTDTTEATVPTTVTILDGQASATFAVTGQDDAIIDGTQSVAIVAAATGFANGNAIIDVTDDDAPATETLTVTIFPGTISENGGTATGTVTRSGSTVGNVVVTLVSTDTTEATVASPVTILDGQASATFAVTGQDDAIIDGAQNVTVVASASGFINGSAVLDVTDDDGIPVQGAWTPLGPFSATDGQAENVGTNDLVVGAIHTVLAHPTNADILYVGATNGGIWRTDNATAANPDWTPLTDSLDSQSIGAMVFDLADATSNTVYAGTGRFSSFARIGNDRLGLLRTTDGGQTWQVVDGGGTLAGKNISGVYANGNTIVVSANTSDAGGVANAGVFRSTDNGATFVQMSVGNGAATGLPDGFSYDLVFDPVTTNTLYVPIVNSLNGANGIYKSTDAGATWTKVSTAAVDTLIQANTSNLEMAVGRSNQIYIAIINAGALAQNGLFRSGDGGTTWVAMDTPSTNEGGADVGLNPGGGKGPTSGTPDEIAGGQGSIHFSIVADPNDANIVYVGGDRQPLEFMFPTSIGARDFSGRLFRGDASLALGSQFVHLTHSNVLGAAGGGTASSSAPHADSREMTFDANGNIIEVDDGGIYRRTSPQDNTGDWVSVIGNLQVTEAHDVAWDALSNTAITGNQDTGTTYQTAQGVAQWDSLSTADGGDVAIDNIQLAGANQSVRYTSSQNLGNFRRTIWDAAGNQLVGTTFPALTETGGSAAFSPAFVTPVETNNVAGNRLLIQGSNSLYESLDGGSTINEIGAGVGVTSSGIFSNAIWYGGTQNGIVNPDLVWAASGSDVFVRTAGTGNVVATAGDPTNGTIRDIAVDSNDWSNAFVADNNQVFMTDDTGATWSDITGDLLTTADQIHSLYFVETALNDVIIAGTDNGIFVASTSNLGTWVELGTGFPTILVYDMDYDAGDDILVAGTLGRGAWSLENVSTSIDNAV